MRGTQLVLRALKGKSCPQLRQHPCLLLLKSCMGPSRRMHSSIFTVLSGDFGKKFVCTDQSMELRVGSKKQGLAPSTFFLLHWNNLFSGFGSCITVYQLYRISCVCMLLPQESQGGILHERQSARVLSLSSPLEKDI